MGTEKTAISDDMVHRLTQARRKRYYDAQEAMNALRARKASGEKIDHSVMMDQAKKVLETDIAAGKSDAMRMIWQAKDRSGFKPHDPSWRAKAKAKKAILPAAALLAAAGSAYALHRRRKKKKEMDAKTAGFVSGMEKAAISRAKALNAAELRLHRAMGPTGTLDDIAKGVRGQHLVDGVLRRQSDKGSVKSPRLAKVKEDLFGARPKGPTSPRKPSNMGDETRQ